MYKTKKFQTSKNVLPFQMTNKTTNNITIQNFELKLENHLLADVCNIRALTTDSSL